MCKLVSTLVAVMFSFVSVAVIAADAPSKDVVKAEAKVDATADKAKALADAKAEKAKAVADVKAAKAEKAKAVEIARKMLTRKRPLNEIVEDTGLSEDEIKAIK